uniref:Adenylate cyclase n=1 Tax=Rhipicephalus appendiculatus TaxID=34631 RepID=A0A131Z4I9_RHIAP
MPSNVELKARLADRSRLIDVVRTMAHAHSVLRQQDTYFGAARGRLKLRLQELLAENGEAQRLLSRSMGVRGIVQKRRDLFLVGQTRVHVDTVEGLGDFVELEVVLEDTQTTEDGQAIAKGLCKELGIGDDGLISGSYIDMLPHQPLWQ